MNLAPGGAVGLARRQASGYTGHMLSDEGRSPHDEFAHAAEAPAMPWEQHERSLAWRLWATLGSTFHPVRDVARVSHGAVAAAGSFALWTALPAMFLSGILPLTNLLTFETNFRVQVASGASRDAILLDMLRAGGLGVLVTSVAFLLSMWNYVALARFASQEGLAPVTPARAAFRVCLYRAWLMPAALSLFYLTLWVGPEINEARTQLAVFAFWMLPSLVLMQHMSAVARYLGASLMAAFPVSSVPLLVFWVALIVGHTTLVELGLLVIPEVPAP